VTWEIVAIAITVLAHFVGAGVLIWALLDGEKLDWRGMLFPGDDDGGWGGYDPPPGDPPRDGGGVRSTPPLPDASPSHVRLREPGRIADAKPRPPRRPEHPPAPTPSRTPAKH
jgi:hypothetical protein